MEFALRSRLSIAVLLLAATTVVANKELKTDPNWIWIPVHSRGEVPTGACFFRRSFELDRAQSATLEIAADDSYEVFVNGKPAGRGGGWRSLAKLDLTHLLNKGSNAIAIKVVNRQGKTAGLAAKLQFADGSSIVTDRSWKCSKIALPKWQQDRFADSNWKSAIELGVWGKTAPWIETPLPSSRRIAAINSPTKPKRVEYLPLEDDSRVVTAANEESVKPAGKPEPLLLRPLTENFPWLKKRARRKPNTDSQAVPIPPPPHGRGQPASNRQTGPQEISNPHLVTPSKTTVTPKPELPQPIEVQPSVGRLADPNKDSMPKPPAELTDAVYTPRDGFTVEKLVPAEKTGSLISTTFNEFGQVLAGQENGPLLLMVDSDDDQKLDTVRIYCEMIKNCHGILALSGMVFVVADGPEGPGLYRLRDEDHDGKLEVASLLVSFEVSSAEHGPHGIVLGPDGKLYVVAGNHTTLKGKFSNQSPRLHLYEGDMVPRYEDPGGHAKGIRLPAGSVIRTDINGHKVELFASGLRNAYDIAFNSVGQLFTYDSDMESDLATNWYRPTRLYHVLPGSEFGWRSGWSKWPEYYHDAVPPVAETGRGSPTGMVFYQHDTYPTEYHDVAFLADWSEGRILTASFEENGAGYKVDTKPFLEGKPLNVTDIEVGPDGMLYFVTGGRGTHGGLYRVVWNGKKVRKPKVTGISKALVSPQINSGWGRQTVAGIKQSLGKSWDVEIAEAVANPSNSTKERIQALQLMQWVGPIPKADLLLKLSGDPAADIRRMAAYLMASSKDGRVPLRLLEMLSDSKATVRRQACESLVRSHRSVPYENVAPLLSSTDRFEAWSARQLLQLDHPDEWLTQAMASTDARTFIQSATALMTAWPSHDHGIAVVHRAQEYMQNYLSDQDFVDMLRVVQIAVLRGELEPVDVPELRATLAEEFPANEHWIINRELIRLLVRLQVTSIKDRYLEYLASEDLPVADRIHVATHLRFLNADWTTEEKLLLFSHLMPPTNIGNSVAGYLQNVARDFGEQLRPEEDHQIIQGGQKYPSAALTAVLRLPEQLTVDQILDLVTLDRALTASDESTKKLKVAILAVLARDGTDAAMAHVRDVYDKEPLRRIEAAIGLAEQPQGENWDYLVRSLSLVEGEIAQGIVNQLATVDRTPETAEPYRQVIMVGLRLGEKGGTDAVRLLEHWRGFASTDHTPPWNEALKAWQNWYEQTYPNAPAPLMNQSTVASKWDYNKLLSHLNKSTVRNGSVERGRLVYRKAKCADCHQHGQIGESMGPNLSTVSKRFLTKEILDSVMYPSRVISDQFKAKTLITDEGKSYTGIVGSGGPGELLVLQANGTKVRIPTSSIEQTIPSKVSAMPEGLLDSLTIQQVTDLMAFLKESPVEQMTAEPNPSTKR